MDQQTYIKAIERSFGKQNVPHDSDALWAKIDFLQQTQRYRQLISQIAKVNNLSNFCALAFEANFAFQYESQGLELAYEVKQDVRRKSSIDFLRSMPSGVRVFFELRQLKQATSITDSINAQLQHCQHYQVALNGQGEKNQIDRIQDTILSKVQDKDGTPRKFFSAAADAVNIVAVDAADSILKTIDHHDCLLAAYGDTAVINAFQLDVFGLFQEDKPEYLPHIHELAAKCAHFRKTVHGILFLFKKPKTGILAYQLERYLMWNPALIDSARAHRIRNELNDVISLRIRPI